MGGINISNGTGVGEMNDISGIPPKDVKRWGRRAGIAFCVLALCVGIGFWHIAESGNERTEQGTYGNCHRTNIQRAVENENSYNNYLVFKTVIGLSVGSAKSVAEQEQKTEPESIKKAGEAFLSQLKTAVGKGKWIPLTDCNEAVHDPYHYAPPPPKTFSEGEPPLSAFVLGPNN